MTLLLHIINSSRWMYLLQVAIFYVSQGFLLLKWRRDNLCSWSLHLSGNISFHLTPETPSLSGISLTPLSIHFKFLLPSLTLRCLQDFRVWRTHFSSWFIFSFLGDLIYSPSLNKWANTYLHIYILMTSKCIFSVSSHFISPHGYPKACQINKPKTKCPHMLLSDLPYFTK